MELLQDICPFHPELHQLNVMVTDLTEPEALIRQIAQEAQASHPENFAGTAPCVYYKMPYIPPMNPFGSYGS